ncbi:MAG: PilZ domain-containing protein [Sedimentisphaerales bacterium]|nr:PilZ domain-containing protein [Sedimentisphaerales bacterium]
MNEVVMLDGSKPRDILQTAIDHRVPAIMSYLSKGKWHVAKVLVTTAEDDKLSVQTVHSRPRQHPINIKIGQPVGMSFKYDYGKYVFDATVMALEPAVNADTGGTIVLTMPAQIEVIQRRSYFRVEVPESLKVNVTIWHRKSRQNTPDGISHQLDGGADYCTGRLVDISAGGAQVALDAESSAQQQFRQGQFIGMRFTPLPYETPLLLNAQIRNALPRADGDSIFLGLQLVGLEASPEGRKILAKLVGVVERYYKMNEASSKKKHKTQAAASA